MVNYTSDQIFNLVEQDFADQKIAILAPLVKARKGHYRDLFEQLARQGYIRVRIDGVLQEITRGMKLDRYKTHDIELVIDRIRVGQNQDDRLKKSILTAIHHGKGVLMILDIETNKQRYFSQLLMCPTSGISYDLPEPNSFSFNSPKGACSNCNSKIQIVDQHRVNWI